MLLLPPYHLTQDYMSDKYPSLDLNTNEEHPEYKNVGEIKEHSVLNELDKKLEVKLAELLKVLKQNLEIIGSKRKS